MAIERLVEPTAAEGDIEEAKIEVSLRPMTFGEYIGQEHLKNNLKLKMIFLQNQSRIFRIKINQKNLKKKYILK